MIEKSGIPTVSVSVLQEITDLVEPPRVLFQKRALGRTLGDPHARELQKSIVVAALEMLKESKLPCRRDFKEQ